MSGRRLALALMIAAGVACSSEAPAETFDAPDLDAIVLQPGDAPAGTEWAASISGPTDLQRFARDAQELELLQQDRFRQGYLSLFVPPGYDDPDSALPPLPVDAVFVQGIAGLFATGDGAHAALGRFVTDLRTNQIPSAENVDAKGLGEESFGIQGEVTDGAHVLIYVWRRGNLIMSVSGAGDIDSVEVRSLADLVDARAVGLA